MSDPATIIKPGQFSMEIPGQISVEIDTQGAGRTSSAALFEETAKDSRKQIEILRHAIRDAQKEPTRPGRM